MGHKQPLIPMQTDNTTENGLVANSIASKRINKIDMRLHWLRCRSTQGQFLHYCIAGATNLWGYVIKQHAAIHNQTVRPTYLTTKRQLELLMNKTIIKEY